MPMHQEFRREGPCRPAPECPSSEHALQADSSDDSFQPPPLAADSELCMHGRDEVQCGSGFDHSGRFSVLPKYEYLPVSSFGFRLRACMSTNTAAKCGLGSPTSENSMSPKGFCQMTLGGT